MMILMLHILYQKHHLDLPKCLVENLMFFTSNHKVIFDYLFKSSYMPV